MAGKEIDYGICLKRANEIPKLFLVFLATPVYLNNCMYVTRIGCVWKSGVGKHSKTADRDKWLERTSCFLVLIAEKHVSRVLTKHLHTPKGNKLNELLPDLEPASVHETAVCHVERLHRLLFV